MVQYNCWKDKEWLRTIKETDNMDTETLKAGLNAIDDRNAITVEGSEFLTELRQVAGAVAKEKDTRAKLKFID